MNDIIFCLTKKNPNKNEWDKIICKDIKCKKIKSYNFEGDVLDPITNPKLEIKIY